jgi:hypothetical protein
MPPLRRGHFSSLQSQLKSVVAVSWAGPFSKYGWVNEGVYLPLL